MKRRIRVIFIVFIILSFSFLVYYNQNLEPDWMGISTDSTTAREVLQQAISARVGVIIYIFLMVTASILYLIYESYRVMYDELADRMEMLDASRNDLQTTYDSVNIFFIEIDPDLIIRNTNSAFSESIGKRKSSIIGRNLFAVLDFGVAAKEVLFHALTEAFDGKGNARLETIDGNRIYEALIFPLKASENQAAKVLLMLNDVTRERARERQMLQDNKMIAVGQLAAGVAHEIRNPLGIIRNYCYILKNSDDYERNVIEHAISSIEKAVDKSSRIIDNLLDFSRISNNAKETVKLGEFIRAIISLEENLLETRQIRVSIEGGNDIILHTIPESLEIILINLILNSADAMPDGGELTIRYDKDIGFVKISVTDTGIGIPSENIGSIFNPFFTTKAKRDGSGLGLYIVYNEMEKLQGRIVAESKVGEGTSFYMVFPEQGEEPDDGQRV
ncbi:MAG: hypothetical protein CVU86_00705 [Firmicutes bacterium HGW-Firmicutes-11]|jgi:polar amino acid transport system substrate-binding protein|nr:MAG: hypothetical protein CVU86_00705 [Firmicutes bacterium HGW-Firmicutes-11]